MLLLSLNLLVGVYVPLSSTRFLSFKEIHEKDRGQETENPHVLAKRHLASGAPTTLTVVNSLQPFAYHSSRARPSNCYQTYCGRYQSRS